MLGKGERRLKTGPWTSLPSERSFSRSDFLWLRVENSDEGEGVDYIWQFLIIRKGGGNNPTLD